MLSRLISLLVLPATLVFAHPMGNFSVSHYTRISPHSGRVSILYSLDLAEIPTFEMMREVRLDSSLAAVEQRARQQMKTWLDGLRVTVDGRPLVLMPGKIEAWAADGAGGMPVVRVAAHLFAVISSSSVKLEYEDTNFDGRAGWKEIVVAPGQDVRLIQSTQSSTERSKALAEYPADSTAAPPQDLKTSLEWQRLTPPPPAVSAVPKTPTKETMPTLPAAGGPQQQTPGTVQRGDFLSTLLGKQEIPFTLALAGLGAAFVLGAMHAMSPGHGKTIVAAYLVGSRGTVAHAAFLGAMVTFTHTVSVFLLGLATLFLSNYILPEKIVPWLGAISGLSIVLIGVSLFRKRLATLLGRESHGHHHHHGHDHHHDHDDGHTHDDGQHHHPHVPESEVTLAGLVALGVSGGLVPCPSALVLLLSAIAIGRTGLGLLLLIAFSLGLALVLMGIGVLVLYAKSLVPSSSKITTSAAFRLIPVLSAAVIVCVGLLMTGASIGVFKPIGF